MADYYNISQLIEICPGSPAQMSLSELGSPWANIPTAPSAGCVHLTRKKIWLLLSRVCYLQHRYFYCNMDCRALQRGGLLSAKSDSWHTPCAGDLADAAAAQLVVLLASHVHVCRQQMVGDIVLHGQVEQQLGHAVCEDAQRTFQHVRHCVGQERSGVLHLQVAVIEPNSLFYELTLAAAVSQWRVYSYHFLCFRRKPKSALFLVICHLGFPP